MNRIVKILIAAVVAMSPLLVSAQPANADEARYVKRYVTINGKETSRNVFAIYGKVSPCGRYKWTHLQYKRYASGTYRTIRHDKTNGSAVYYYGKVKALGYYRTAVFKTGECSAAYSGYIRIYRVGRTATPRLVG
jgi:hypothetical protein